LHGLSAAQIRRAKTADRVQPPFARNGGPGRQRLLIDGINLKNRVLPFINHAVRIGRAHADLQPVAALRPRTGGSRQQRKQKQRGNCDREVTYTAAVPRAGKKSEMT